MDLAAHVARFWSLATMKTKNVILVLLLLVSLCLTGCASLRPSAAEESTTTCNRQEQKSLKPGDDPLLDLLYYVAYGVAAALSGN